MAISKINTPEIFDLGATNTSLKLPSGGTDSRPTNPSTGQWRYNTDLKYVEYYDGNDWQQIDIEEECTTNTVNFPSGTTNVVYSKLNYSARDESSNNYDGTLGDITFVNGSPYSQAAEFNGTSSDIEFPAAFVSGYTGSVTASIWFKTTVNSTDIKVIINSADGFSGSDAGFAVYTETGKLRFTRWNIPTTVGLVGTTSIDDGFWHHLVIVFDNANGTMKVYLDNDTSNPEFSVTGLATNQNYNKVFKTAWFLGQQSSIAARFFPGQQTQLRLISSAISTSQVSELYNEVQCPCTTNTIGYSVDAIGSTTNTSTEAYYKLDGNPYDATANAYNGTWGGTEAYAVSPYGVAAVFDGSSSQIVTGIDLTSFSSASLSVWVYWTGGNFKPIFGGNNTTTHPSTTINRFNTGISDSGGRLDYISKQGDFFRTTDMSLFSSNAWNHIVISDDFTTNSTSSKLYVNGQLENSFARIVTGYGGAINTNLYIGQGRTNNNGQDYLTGTLDQVRIYSTVLDSDQVTDLYNEVYCNTISTLDVFGDSTGVALYELNGNADSTDSSTYNGTWTGTEAYAGGYFDRAAVFNGSSSKIDTSLSLDTNNVSGGSISLWFKTSQTTPAQILIGSQTSQNGASFGSSILLGPATGASPSESISVWDYNGVTTSAFYTEGGSDFYQDNNWHHLVITSTSSSKNIYIDGISQTIFFTGQGSATANLKFTDIQIGATLGYTGTNYFDGEIDQVRIFTKVLTEFEVLQLYSE